MDYQDKTIKCRDCGKDFIFSAGEQAFFAEKGFDRAPIRCTECRKAKKQGQGPKKSFTPPQEEGIHTITCKSCGKSLEVPFRPQFPDDVLCEDCFQK